MNKSSIVRHVARGILSFFLIIYALYSLLRGDIWIIGSRTSVHLTGHSAMFASVGVLLIGISFLISALQYHAKNRTNNLILLSVPLCIGLSIILITSMYSIDAAQRREESQYREQTIQKLRAEMRNSPDWKMTAELYGEAEADRMLNKSLNEAKRETMLFKEESRKKW
ncbi:hypothetical protein VU04_04110 [Desulfobulbus sp. TB]|nr:hypothetical protein [Desulfobulbus sp. TB]